MTILFRMHTNKLSVDAAASLLKRLYWAERELFRSSASRHGCVADWSAKKAIPRHLWEDTLHADVLRDRVMELRYPRRDVDHDPPRALLDAVDELTRAGTDAEILSGIYEVFKPALLDAYEHYVAGTDPLDDAPTIYLLRRIIQDKRAQIDEGRALLAALPAVSQHDTAAWTDYLREVVSAAGGILDDRPIAPAPIAPGFSDRPAYQRPARLARDPKFEPALVESPWWTDMTPLERQVYQAIEHVNEMWATEVPLLVAWEMADMPWEFYRDLARWAWDECRHTIMGERRLEAWGFVIGVDIPMIDDAYQCVVTEPPIALLGLLNAFERHAPPAKKRLKAAFEAMGDQESAQDVDYDWADEAIHMTIGNRWLQHLIQDEDELDALRARTLEQWEAYIVWARSQPLGDYEPFETRIRSRLRALEDSV